MPTFDVGISPVDFGTGGASCTGMMTICEHDGAVAANHDGLTRLARLQAGESCLQLAVARATVLRVGVAVQVAKSRHTPVVVYQPEIDRRDTQRLMLAGSLRRAIAVWCPKR